MKKKVRKREPSNMVELEIITRKNARVKFQSPIYWKNARVKLEAPIYWKMNARVKFQSPIHWKMNARKTLLLLTILEACRKL